ncbi:MAG: hypothetical protein RIT45_3742 [Pseudomonadota bacterium]|jgi:hypothetical protein
MLQLLVDSVTTMADAPIEDAVRSYVRAMLRAHALEPALHQALARHVMTNGLGVMDELDALISAAVRGYLELHRARLVVRDLDAAAWVLLVTVRALAHVGALHRPSSISEEALLDEVCAVVLRYLLGPNAPDLARLATP